MIKLKELRKAHEMTQKDVAKIVGATSQAVLNWENGINEPNIETLIKLADYFNVSLDYLAGRKSAQIIIDDLEAQLDLLSKPDFVQITKKYVDSLLSKTNKN